MKIGLFYAFLTVIFWALDTVFSRYAIVALDVNSAIFACLSLFIGASVLIIVVGVGKSGLITQKGSMVTRVGGDEFCILLPKRNREKP